MYHFLGPHPARTLDQYQVAGPDARGQPLAGLDGSFEKDRAAAIVPESSGRGHHLIGQSLDAEDQIKAPTGRRPAARPVEPGAVSAQLQHLSRNQNFPSIARMRLRSLIMVIKAAGLEL